MAVDVKELRRLLEEASDKNYIDRLLGEAALRNALPWLLDRVEELEADKYEIECQRDAMMSAIEKSSWDASRRIAELEAEVERLRNSRDRDYEIVIEERDRAIDDGLVIQARIDKALGLLEETRVRCALNPGDVSAIRAALTGEKE